MTATSPEPLPAELLRLRACLQDIRDRAHRAANGGLRLAGQPDRIGAHMDAWRAVRDLADEALDPSPEPGYIRFCDLAEGDRFEFDRRGLFANLALGPWVKTSARTYRREDELDRLRVGSIHVTVQRLPKP